MTLETFPHLEALGKIPGVVDFLVTEVSTSEEKNFPLVEFIDTPGLTDGTLKYPFDVDNVIYELAEHATMIMVFLDPIGKALVSRCARARACVCVCVCVSARVAALPSLRIGGACWLADHLYVADNAFVCVCDDSK